MVIGGQWSSPRSRTATRIPQFPPPSTRAEAAEVTECCRCWSSSEREGAGYDERMAAFSTLIRSDVEVEVEVEEGGWRREGKGREGNRTRQEVVGVERRHNSPCTR